MEETEIKKEYDELLAVYSRKRSECEQMERQIPIVRTEIEQLKVQIGQFLPPPQHNQDSKSTEQAEQEQQQLISQQQEFAALLNALEHSLKENNSETTALALELNTLSTTSSSFIFTDKTEELQKYTELLSTSQKIISEEAGQIKTLQKEIGMTEMMHSKLQTELNSLNENKVKQTPSKQANPEEVKLEQELKKIEQEEKDLEEEVKQQEVALDKKKKNVEAQEKKLKDELTKLNQKNVTLQTTLAKLEGDLNTADNKQPVNAPDNEVKELEEASKALNKQNEVLGKELAHRKTELGKKKDEARKEKNKEKKNYGKQIIEEQTFSDLQARELEREKNKLENTIKLRKSYVSQESLQILQKEYERHQQKNKPHLQTEQNRKDRLTRERDVIKSRIDLLINSSRQLETEAEGKLKELNQKGDESVKEKLAYEKAVNEATFKLNEYTKEFPNHEKRKEDLKNEEKKRKQEAKDKSKIQSKERDSLKRRKDKEEQKRILEESDQTAWQDWKEWEKQGLLGKREETSFFNNKQFQLIAGVIAVISILALSFS